MKKNLLLLILLFVTLITQAQFRIWGRVLEERTDIPVEGATISIGKDLTVSDERGNFELIIRKKDEAIEVSSINHITFRDNLVNYFQNNKFTQNGLIIHLIKRQLFLQPVEVLATRANDRSPFTKTNIGNKQIEELNDGRDIPFVLNQVPSAVVNADAGTGIGYTGLRIRGTDLSRVNVTLNGIPYNDAESQGVFFVDLPDITSSINSIQIQRGVGTSSNGAGAFGATINISTNEFNETPNAEISNSYGSFNTWKHTVKIGSGLLNDHFTIDARLSKISSDGYIDRATSDLRSYFISGAYITSRSQLRLNIIGGKEKTYQAWYGVPDTLLSTHRTFNPAGTEKPGDPYNNETDNYQQDHYQLFFNHSLNNNLYLNIAGFYTKGRGYYEEYRAAQNFTDYGLPDFISGTNTITKTDLVRQLWLDNNFYGSIFSLQQKSVKRWLTVGGGWTKYEGNHFGNVIWAQLGIPKDYQWYKLNALKNDYNIYGKWQEAITSSLEGFLDLQYRKVKYDLNGFQNNPGLKIKNNYDFFNPKIGISYSAAKWKTYLSYAVANKEPNRDDFEAGITQQPKYETLNDVEWGLQQKAKKFNWSATLFYMQYHNQLVLTGKINDVGAYTRTNIPHSCRLGIELEGTITPSSLFSVEGNLALSENKIRNFQEFIDDYDNGNQKMNQYAKTDISYSPNVVAFARVNFLPVNNLKLTLSGKYVGHQFLDNTSNLKRQLNPFYVTDFRVYYNIKKFITKEIDLTLGVNNLFNVKYEPNGYTYPYYSGGALITQNYYFPMAGTNWFFGLQVNL